MAKRRSSPHQYIYIICTVDTRAGPSRSNHKSINNASFLSGCGTLCGIDDPYMENDCGAEVGTTGKAGKDGCCWACGGGATVLCRTSKELVGC